jgi:hypothetical protein
LAAESYKKTEKLTRTVTEYIDKVAKFNGARRKAFEITRRQIKRRELVLAIPPDSAAAQLEALKQLVKYAAAEHVLLKIIGIK